MPEFSKKDVTRGITTPDTHSEDLAEFFGIYAGDGCLAIYRRGTTTDYRLTFSGDRGDQAYFLHIDNLAKRLFNIHSKPVTQKYEKRGWANLIYRSKAVVTYFSENGYSAKTKAELGIPKWVQKDPRYARRFLRGLFDTDGHLANTPKGRLNAYPRFVLKFKPRGIVTESAALLTKLGFTTSTYLDVNALDKRDGKTYVKNHLYLNGWKNFVLWKDLIGSSNPKNLAKIKALEQIHTASLNGQMTLKSQPHTWHKP